MSKLSLDPPPFLETTDSGLLLLRDNIKLSYDKIQDVINNLDGSNIKDGSLSTSDILLDRYACRASSNTNTNCPSGAFTQLILDFISDYNEGSCFSTVTSQYTVAMDGLYEIAGTAHVAGVATQQAVSLCYFINGTIIVYGVRYTSWPGDNIGIITSVYDVVNLNAGMTVDLRLDNVDTGGGPTTAVIQVFPQYSLPRFTIRRIGPKTV